jgi:hypothetical protein
MLSRGGEIYREQRAAAIEVNESSQIVTNNVEYA